MREHLARVASMSFMTLLLVALPLITACGADDEEEITPTPTVTEEPRISFDEDSVYLGEATPEQLMHYEFRFQNIGNAPLVVHSARAKTLEGC
jgi:hypothetical protein